MPGTKPAPPLWRGADEGAGAQDAPAIAVDELDLLVEGHLVDHEVGAGVGIEGRVHPGWRGSGWSGERFGARLGRVRSQGGRGTRARQVRRQVAAVVHWCELPFVRTHQYTVRFGR